MGCRRRRSPRILVGSESHSRRVDSCTRVIGTTVPPRVPMPRFWPRLLKSVLPVALLAAGGGYLYAVAAGAYVADGRDDGTALRETLVWRVPLTMAAWAG